MHILACFTQFFHVILSFLWALKSNKLYAKAIAKNVLIAVGFKPMTSQLQVDHSINLTTS